MAKIQEVAAAALTYADFAKNLHYGFTRVVSPVQAKK